MIMTSLNNKVPKVPTFLKNDTDYKRFYFPATCKKNMGTLGTLGTTDEDSQKIGRNKKVTSGYIWAF